MKKLKTKFVIVSMFAIFVLCLTVPSIMEVKAASSDPVVLEIGTLLVNVEKVDLSASSCRLDFYLWFSYNPLETSRREVEQFEFVNGAPTLYVVAADDVKGYPEYRVRGDFINSFDFSR